MTKNGFLRILILVFFSLGFSNLAMGVDISHSVSCHRRVCHPYNIYFVDGHSDLNLYVSCANPKRPYLGYVMFRIHPDLNCKVNVRSSSKSWRCSNPTGGNKAFHLNSINCEDSPAE
jgi:hypothetical protein